MRAKDIVNIAHKHALVLTVVWYVEFNVPLDTV